MDDDYFPMGPAPIVMGSLPEGYIEGRRWEIIYDNSELETGDWVHVSTFPNNQYGQSADYIGIYNKETNTIRFNDGNPPENIDEIYGENKIISVLKNDIDLRGILAKKRRRESGGRVIFESRPDYYTGKQRRLNFGNEVVNKINKMINYLLKC